MDVQDQAYAPPTAHAAAATPSTADDGTSRPQKAARFTLAMLLFGLGLFTLREYLSALAWATVFAIATWPLYQRAETRWPPGRHNLINPSVFTAAVALLFVVPLVLVALEVGREWHGVAEWVHQARTSGVPVPEFVKHLPLGENQATAWWQENLSDPQGAADLLGRLDRGQVVQVGRTVGSMVLRRTVLFGFTLLTLFFLYRDGLTVTAQMLTGSRKAFGPGGERVGRQMVASVRGTVNGLVLVGLGEGAVLGLAYGVAGVPHPALLGAATAVAAMIPFGAPLAVGVAALLLAATGSMEWAIALFVFGLVVAFVADHAVRPALIGGSTRLPFLWVLLGILGGVESWGLLGLFLGPAIMAALILLWREWTERAQPP
jgi:predicted PurR-regulated permease PerM